MAVVSITVSNLSTLLSTKSSMISAIEAGATYEYVEPVEVSTQECATELATFTEELHCNIANVSCDVTNYNRVGKPTKSLQKAVLRMQNMLYVINNYACQLTCEEIESFRCIMRSLKF